MKVLLINTYDRQGGAARAVGRLVNGLKEAGCDVALMAQNKESSDPGIIKSGSGLAKQFNFIRPYIDFAIPLPQVRQRILFSSSLLPDQVIRSINKIKPDIVHLNWIAGGMIRIESLARIEQPVVWTFHDLWAITGGCHYPPNCTRYRESCGRCPLLHSGREIDLSRKVFERKRSAYFKIKNLTVITPSKWLAGCVRSGPLMEGRPLEVIPNGLDTSVFKPLDKRDARQRFNLPPDKKLILFGGIRAVEYKLKGFQLLLEALKNINDTDAELVVFGSGNLKTAGNVPLKTHSLGYISGEAQLAELYNAADVVAVPSYQEIFGQTASEALSCGIPVVAFAATGLLDIVDHLLNGYLAKPFETDDLAHGINWILEDKARYKQLSHNAHMKVLNQFDITQVAGRVMGVYEKTLSGKLL
jgi:glycosyltransferase involved in cell wall biosynthesis